MKDVDVGGKDIVDNYESLFESRNSGGAIENSPEAKAPGKPETKTISSWSYDMEESCEEMLGNILRT